MRGVISAGGQGRVYLVRDASDGKLAALKTLWRTYDPNDREIVALSRLSHGSAPRLYASGPLDEGMYIAMEHFDGKPLAEWVEVERCDVWSWLCVLHSFFSMLEHAHACGLTHGDLRSANVLMRGDRTSHELCVVDWGIARQATAPLRERDLRALAALSSELAPIASGPRDARVLPALGAVTSALVAGDAARARHTLDVTLRPPQRRIALAPPPSSPIMTTRDQRNVFQLVGNCGVWVHGATPAGDWRDHVAAIESRPFSLLIVYAPAPRDLAPVLRRRKRAVLLANGSSPARHVRSFEPKHYRDGIAWLQEAETFDTRAVAQTLRELVVTAGFPPLS